MGLTRHKRAGDASVHKKQHSHSVFQRRYVECRIKMCRRAAHRASTTAATVAGGVADTSLRVADGIVSRMGNSNYGQ